MKIEIYSDIVCPWCYIGKRQIDAAVAERAKAGDPVAPRIIWRPFQLNPQMPAA